MNKTNQAKRTTAKTARKTTSTRKPGRPKGAKTKQLPTVQEIPAKCPRCGSTSRTRKTNQRAYVRPEHIATTATARTITRWSQVQCRQCNQLYRIREVKTEPI